MISSLLFFAQTSIQSDPIHEFISFKPGTEWVYQDEIKEGRLSYKSKFTETAQESIVLDGLTVYPIESKDGNSRKDIINYVAEGETLDVYMPKIVIPKTDTSEEKIIEPSRYTVFTVTNKTTSWNYFGKTPYNGDRIDMTMEATAKNIGMKDVLGQKVECIEVKLNTEVNIFAETGFVPRSGKGMLSEQTAIYARGIGLVELKEKRKLDKQTGELTRKLISYNSPKS